MSVTGDFVVAYVLWARDGTVIQQGSLALLQSVADPGEILGELKKQLGNELQLDRSNLGSISYTVLVPAGQGYHRFNGWFDQAEFEASDEMLSTVATAAPEVEMTLENSDELIETVEEMLREEREDN